MALPVEFQDKMQPFKIWRGSTSNTPVEVHADRMVEQGDVFEFYLDGRKLEDVSKQRVVRILVPRAARSEVIGPAAAVDAEQDRYLLPSLALRNRRT